jgi:hypothetical protein
MPSEQGLGSDEEPASTGSNDFGIGEVEGVRQHGIAHFLDMVGSCRIGLTPMLTPYVPLTSGATPSPCWPTGRR